MTATSRSLYLVRHAIAAERSDKWPDDAQRPLTNEGAWRMRRAVKGMIELGAKIDLVLTSALVRAVETAEILARGLEPAPEIVVLPVLAPGGAPARIAEALGGYQKARSIALVGHAPDIGEFAAWLIGSRTPLPLKKGAVCRIDVSEWPPARQGELIWSATPKMLRALA
jgi:phosphohistidine phosphatase